jgi:mono/diheme cytochrome c family protein
MSNFLPCSIRNAAACFYLLTSLTVFVEVIAIGHFVAGQEPAASVADPEGIAFFEQRIRPIFAEHCYSCHSASAKTLQANLLLDSSNSILAGGDSGPSIIPNKPDESLLIQSVRYSPNHSAMPPDGKLLDEQIAALEAWVRRGAPVPSSEIASKIRTSIDIEEGRKHWAFQPTKPLPAQFFAPPDSASPDSASPDSASPDSASPDSAQHQLQTSNSRIDVAIERELKKQELSLSPREQRRGLLRRLKMDLVGVLPTSTEVLEFEHDSSPEAFERRIDAYLASPQYGERWARYWLDLVRYCDVMEEWTETLGPTYPYRDWVVSAFNEDMPFDRFIHLQLAADQLPDARPSDRAALGLLGMSPSYWKELQLPVEIIKSIVSDEVEERVHTLSSTFLGLNIACARCHDHKFDPITNLDYYAIAGILSNSKPSDVALAPDLDAAAIVEARKGVKKLESELQPLLKSEKEEDKAKVAELQQRLEALRATKGFDALLTPGVEDARLEVLPADGSHGSKIVFEKALRDKAVEIRGNPNKAGETVPRRFISVLSHNSPPAPFGTEQASGRAELARSMTSDSAHLVARVFVNRIWKHHFGRGLVETPSDFGRQGTLPSHPELLDDLAYRFIEQGWSIKWLHREILLSNTYQQQRSFGPGDQRDPDQRLYASFPRRALDVEAWRDSILETTGELNNQIGGPPEDLSKLGRARRTIYGQIRRRELNDLLRLFDFPDPLTHSASRVPTITPLQQLYLLNSPFILERSDALIRRLELESINDTDQRIEKLYGWLFQRSPTPAEWDKLRGFIQPNNDQQAWQLLAQSLLASNAFYFVE